jgi:hypothetical protein
MRRTGSDSVRTNATKTVSDAFRHRSGTGKPYCRTRSDVGLERVKGKIEERQGINVGSYWMALGNREDTGNWKKNTRSYRVENPFWKGLWKCRKRDNMKNECIDSNFLGGHFRSRGHAAGSAVGWETALPSRKFAGSIPDGVIGNFHWHNPSDSTMALGSTQPLTEMSSRNISWG